MIESVIGIIALIALTGLFVFLTLRVLRPRRNALKFIGAFFTGLVALVGAALTVVALIGFTRLYLPNPPEVADFTVQATLPQIERGAHLASMTCADCHSLNRSAPLSGGADLGEGAPFPLGSMPAYNLTPAGPLADWSDADIYRAIRYNVDPNGRRLAVMASTGISNLSDADVHALIAFLRSQPPTGSETRQEKLSFVTTILSGAGMLPLRTNMQPVTAVDTAASAEYGKYMVDYLSCGDCHGAGLTGGTPGGLFPAGPNIAASVSGWTQEQFAHAIRTGERPYSPPLNAEIMPYLVYKNMDDTELAAVYQYIVSLPE